jgi:hypothetical protein
MQLGDTPSSFANELWLPNPDSESMCDLTTPTSVDAGRLRGAFARGPAHALHARKRPWRAFWRRSGSGVDREYSARDASGWRGGFVGQLAGSLRRPRVGCASVSADFSPGTVVARKYRVERTLGAGAMGVVLEVTHLELQERMALKFLHGEAAKSEEVVQRFLREARASRMIRATAFAQSRAPSPRPVTPISDRNAQFPRRVISQAARI